MIVEKTLDGSVRLTVTTDEYEMLYAAVSMVSFDEDLSPTSRTTFIALAREMRAGLMELGQ